MPPSGGGRHRDRPHVRPSLPYPDPLHLLVVTVISAQDLFPAVKSSMRAYAVVRASTAQKRRTRTDRTGHTSPTWDDKLTFHIDDAILWSDTSGISIDIYAARSRFWPGRDILLGTARTLLSTIQPSLSVQFAALQVRRPGSLRPQGILNISVALVDEYAMNLPLIGITKRASDTKEMVEMVEAAAAEKAVMAKSPSVREMAMKLERWRVELPTAKGEEGLGKIKEVGEGAERSAAAAKIGRATSRRTARWPGTDGGVQRSGGRTEDQIVARKLQVA